MDLKAELLIEMVCRLRSGGLRCGGLVCIGLRDM